MNSTLIHFQIIESKSNTKLSLKFPIHLVDTLSSNHSDQNKLLRLFVFLCLAIVDNILFAQKFS